MRLFVLAIAFVCAAGGARAAQAWRPAIESRCVAAIGEQGGHWPQWSECIARHLYGWSEETQARFYGCLDRIAKARVAARACNQCGDPDRDVALCMQE